MFGFKRKNPYEALKAFTRHADFTPDLVELSQYKRQAVFVCDEMQEGHWKHGLLKEGGEFRAMGYTQHKLVMFKRDLGRFSTPLLFRPEEVPFHGVQSGRVQGELYSVDSRFMTELDKWKGNTLYTIRQRMQIAIPFRPIIQTSKGPVLGEERWQGIPAWVYLSSPEIWVDQLDAGYNFPKVQLYEQRRSWLEEIYYFSANEYPSP